VLKNEKLMTDHYAIFKALNGHVEVGGGMVVL
jgi:hypothetical protein